MVDCVASDDILARWRSIATEHGGDLYVIETVCGDEDLHRQRVEGRVRGIPGWHEIDWNHVLRMRAETKPLTTPRLILDAVHPVAENLARVLDCLPGSRED